jgi:hypothetical protein
MFSHFLAPLQRFFATGSALELGLLVTAILAVGVVLRVRAVRGAAKTNAAPSTAAATAPPDVTPVQTARQWLARETVMNDLPPLRETVVPPVAETNGPVATFVSPAYESRAVDDAIVFPTGRAFGEYRTADLPPPRNAVDLPEASTIANILTEGLDDLATGGDRLAEAVRERPIQYLMGALAAGFAAGLWLPTLYGQQRITKLLERLIESNEELKAVRLEDRREARADIERRETERFRQSRPS